VPELWTLGLESPATMKTIHHILGIIWIIISGYFCVSSSLTIFRIIGDFHLMSMVGLVFFTLLYLAGAVASFYILRDSRLGRVIVGIVALLTVLANLIGLSPFLNMQAFSSVGIALDIFALASASILLFSRKYVAA